MVDFRITYTRCIGGLGNRTYHELCWDIAKLGNLASGNSEFNEEVGAENPSHRLLKCQCQLISITHRKSQNSQF